MPFGSPGSTPFMYALQEAKAARGSQDLPWSLGMKSDDVVGLRVVVSENKIK
jgi:hypothetical protein